MLLKEPRGWVFACNSTILSWGGTNQLEKLKQLRQIEPFNLPLYSIHQS